MPQPMTKVLRKVLVVALVALSGRAAGQEAPPPGQALALYRELRSVGLDPQRVYRVRDVNLDRSAIHLTLNDGTLAFTQAVDGRVTGAFFEGDGEVLLSPPTQAERASLALFTGAAILEERFTTAYLRFNDDTFEQLQGQLRPATDTADFITAFDTMARTLADTDALRLLETFTASAGPSPMLHARLGGVHLGTFDVNYDAALAEPVWAGQVGRNGDLVFYDLWTSFAPAAASSGGADSIRIPRYLIRAAVRPPHELSAEAELEVEGGWQGRRIILFELSRALKLSQVTMETPQGPAALEFLQNEALEGTQRARRGNDVVAVVFPQAPAEGTRVRLKFTYAGAVMTEAGGGLMYVGAKGIWYPNRGLDMSRYDLEFRYPQNWTLVATGQRVSEKNSGGEQVARWVADEPVPLAGFNLGQYERVTAKAGEVTVAVYATRGLETAFPVNRAPDIQLLQPPIWSGPRRPLPPILPPVAPVPALHAQEVAQRSARTVDWMAHRLGPFPYGTLSFTQMPGRVSQGWPGLIFLSSYVFMTGDERLRGKLSELDAMIYGRLVPAHETAHQWFGDQVVWKSYRDQWLVEGLANYCALMLVERENPGEARALLERYRRDLLRKHDDLETRAAGPVTLGPRLSSSKLPPAYEDVLYGRGTWLVHMLRSLLRDTAAAEAPARGRGARAAPADPDELFFQVLRKLIADHRHERISTADVQQAFEAALPRAARFEDRASLDWFFEGWVDGSAIPELELEGVKLAPRGDHVQATGRILQKEAPRLLVTSVPIYAATPAARPVYVGRVFADGDDTSFRLTAPAGTRKLLLDPYGTVLTRNEK